MQTILALLVTTLYLAYPVVGYASYLIQLKSGREFTASRYWKEGGQIKFHAYGGILSIDVETISKIEKKDTPDSEREVPTTQPGPVQKPPTESPREEAAKKLKTASVPKGTNRADDPLINSFEILKERFSSLSFMTTTELYNFSKELTNFKKKVLKSGASNQYIDELSETYTMGDKLEELLKSRSQ